MRMLRGEFPDAGEQSHEELLAAYGTVLAETVETVGVEEIVAETGLDQATVTAFADGDIGDRTLDEAVSVLATGPNRPAADALQAEAQDILLMGMTTAVMDVESLASGIDDELEPKEIQQKIEGRYPVTLAEYALLHSHIEGAKQ
jgi:voltage-gated potassium channel Kch